MLKPVLALFTLLTVSLSAPFAMAEIKWTGGAGIRRLEIRSNDGLGTISTNNTSTTTTGKDESKVLDKRWQFRGNIGAYEQGETVDWAFGIRTYSNQASEWLSVSANADLASTLELANFRAHTKYWESDWAVTVGRQKATFLYDTVAQGLFDKDNRWDGFGWNWKMGGFGLNLSQYILGATARGTGAQRSAFTSTDSSQATADARSHMTALYVFQPAYELKLADDLKGVFGLGYLMWSGAGGNSGANGHWFTNNVHANSPGSVGDINAVNLDNSRQWQLFTDWSLPMGFRFVGEYVRNKTIYYGGVNSTVTNRKASRDMYALSALYGSAKKAKEWTVSYSYVNKGIASVIQTFTNGDMTVDNKSHLLEGKYMLADGVAFGGKLQFHSEKANVGGDGLALTSPYQGRHQSSTRYELYTTAAF